MTVQAVQTFGVWPVALVALLYGCRKAGVWLAGQVQRLVDTHVGLVEHLKATQTRIVDLLEAQARDQADRHAEAMTLVRPKD